LVCTHQLLRDSKKPNVSIEFLNDHEQNFIKFKSNKKSRLVGKLEIHVGAPFNPRNERRRQATSPWSCKPGLKLQL